MKWIFIYRKNYTHFFLQKSFFIEKCITFAVRIRKKTGKMKYIHFAYPFTFIFTLRSKTGFYVQKWINK